MLEMTGLAHGAHRLGFAVCAAADRVAWAACVHLRRVLAQVVARPAVLRGLKTPPRAST